jgi:N-acyl-phosphatidylethanolamine-hydrolysing phospholipase D
MVRRAKPLDPRARQSVAMHFWTFQLTPEGIDQPVRDLRVALNDRGVPAEQFHTL